MTLLTRKDLGEQLLFRIVMLGNLMVSRQALIVLGHQPLIGLNLSLNLTLSACHHLWLPQGLRRLRNCLGNQGDEWARTLLHVLSLLRLSLGRCVARALGRFARTDATVVDIGGQVKDSVRSLVWHVLVERVIWSRGRSRWARRSDNYSWCGRNGRRWRWLSYQRLLLLLFLLLWLGRLCDSWCRVMSPSVGALPSALVILGGLVEDLAESEKNTI